MQKYKVVPWKLTQTLEKWSGNEGWSQFLQKQVNARVSLSSHLLNNSPFHDSGCPSANIMLIVSAPTYSWKVQSLVFEKLHFTQPIGIANLDRSRVLNKHNVQYWKKNKKRLVYSRVATGPWASLLKMD